MIVLHDKAYRLDCFCIILFFTPGLGLEWMLELKRNENITMMRGKKGLLSQWMRGAGQYLI